MALRKASAGVGDHSKIFFAQYLPSELDDNLQNGTKRTWGMGKCAHSHEAVHLTRTHHLMLRGIPYVLVRFPRLQFLQRVHVFSRVRRMQLERVACPSRCALERVICWLVKAKVVRELKARRRAVGMGEIWANRARATRW